MFTVKRIPIKGNGIKIAYLSHNCPQFNVQSVAGSAQIELQSENKSVYTYLQIIEDDSLINSDEIGLNIEAFEEFGLQENQKINIHLAVPTIGIDFLHKKISGEILNSAEYEKILEDIGKQRFSSTQTTAFIMACRNMMTNYELAAIAGILINRKVMKTPNFEKVVSCFSFGRTGNSKSEIIACFITAGAGYKTLKPQNSFECFSKLSNIDFRFSDIGKLLEQNGIVVFNSDILAENKIGKILAYTGQNLGINQNNFMVALVLSAAVSYGITHLLLELPVGKNAEIQTYNEAVRLRGTIEHLADLMGLIVEVCITDGNEPLGNNFGAVLEAQEVVSVLQNSDNAPKDVRERSLFLAGRMLDLLDGCGKKGFALAAEILDSGKAFQVFEDLRNNQGKQVIPSKGTFHRDVLATYDGTVSAINNKVIEQIINFADTADSAGGGIIINKKIGDKVKSGEILYTVYSVDSANFDVINTLVERNNGYHIAIN